MRCTIKWNEIKLIHITRVGRHSEAIPPVDKWILSMAKHRLRTASMTSMPTWNAHETPGLHLVLHIRQLHQIHQDAVI